MLLLYRKTFGPYPGNSLELIRSWDYSLKSRRPLHSLFINNKFSGSDKIRQSDLTDLLEKINGGYKGSPKVVVRIEVNNVLGGLGTKMKTRVDGLSEKSCFIDFFRKCLVFI